MDLLTRTNRQIYRRDKYIDVLFEALVGESTDNDDIAVVVVKNVS